MTDDPTITKRMRGYRRRKRLGLVQHTVETRTDLIPEVDWLNNRMLETEQMQNENQTRPMIRNLRPPQEIKGDDFNNCLFAKTEAEVEYDRGVARGVEMAARICSDLAASKDYEPSLAGREASFCAFLIRAKFFDGKERADLMAFLAKEKAADRS